MTQTTSELGLTLPGGGSTGLNTPADRADIDVLNNNFKLIDTRAAAVGSRANRNFSYRGLAAGLASLTGMVEGDTYKETDGSKILWRYDGANWIGNEGGLYLIRPTNANLVNATVNSAGEIIPNASVKSISVNNCFTSRFRNYVIEFFMETGDANGNYFKFRNGGTDYSANEYRYTDLYASTNTASANATGTATQWGLSAVSGSAQGGILEIWNPALATTKVAFKRTAGNVPASSEIVVGGTMGSIGSLSGLAVDGFTYALSSTALNAIDNTKSWMKIYGKA